MNKFKAGFFLAIGVISVVSVNAMADYTPMTNKATSSFQCSSVVDLPVSETQTEGPTALIETHNRLVRGLCADGDNIVDGMARGKVTQKGHLINLPTWWRDTHGNIVQLSDVCFTTQADQKDFLGRNKEGNVGVLPETGSTSITCHEGCTGQKFDFGVGGFC